MKFFAVCICALLTLLGCTTVDVVSQYEALGDQALPAAYYDVVIPTHDGLELTATVFQPALPLAADAPIIIHAHGFGAFRADGPVSVYGKLILSGEASVEAWRRGYWVVSYDARGFGSSDGQVRLLDPDYEVRDISSVINWIEQSLPRLSRDASGKPMMGMIGESYGGGASIMGSIMDSRIDAIVPITTWYDLSSAFAPNGLVKSNWALMLFGFGNMNSFFDFDMMFEDAYLDMFEGYMNETVEHDMTLRSPSFYCDQGKPIQADALFIQGFSDALFDMNQGRDNWLCARKAGLDARLIAIQDGHKAMWPVQSWTGMPLYNTQPNVTCDDTTLVLKDAIVRWFDEKLKLQPAVANDIPVFCATTSDDIGFVMNDLPMGSIRTQVPLSEVNLVQSGMFEVIMSPLDYLASLLLFSDEPDPVELQGMRGGFLRQGFIPLQVIRQPEAMIGIPRLNLHMSTTDSEQDGVLFVGLGVRHADSFQVNVISEQFLPLTGDGDYKQDMPAVSIMLEAGDTVGLVVQGFTGQYFWNPEGWFSTASVQGEVWLPKPVAKQ